MSSPTLARSLSVGAFPASRSGHTGDGVGNYGDYGGITSHGGHGGHASIRLRYRD